MCSALHAEDAETGRLDRGVEAGRQRQGKNVAGLWRVDDAVIPEAGAGIVGVALMLVLLKNWLLDLRLFLSREAQASTFGLLTLDLHQHASGLFTAHHGNARVRPHPQETRIVGTTAHAVVTGAEATADYYGELRHLGAGHRSDKLGAVFGDAAGLVLLPDHKTGDVL